MKSAPSKQGIGNFFFKIRTLVLFVPKCPKLDIWAPNLKNKNLKKIPDFPNFEILGRFGSFQLVSGRFGSFCLISGRFGSFRVLASTEVDYPKNGENTLKANY